MSMIDLLPAFNACCNALSTGLLICGWNAVKQKKINRHRGFMIAALIVSILFLAGYLTRHAIAGSTPFRGHGVWRKVYFSILISHTILAIVNVPLVATTFVLAFKKRFERHRRWARWTLPIWLYVSVTGVVIFFMLYRWF